MKTVFFVAPTVTDLDRALLRVTACAKFVEGHTAYAVHEILPSEDITRVALKYAVEDGAECLAAAGGDGTVSAVAHAAAETRCMLGIIPAGTGNMVARELGIPLNIEQAVALLAGSPAHKTIDAMRINQRICLLNAGVGINAEVIDRTSRLGKSLFGRSAYVGTAVWKVLQARPQQFKVVVDGRGAQYNATDIAISNCGILARALNPGSPEIRADDGQVDICILCMKTPLEYPWYYFRKRLAHKSINRIMVEMTARHSIAIESETPAIVQADGDIIGTTPITVEVLPGAVSVAVPATACA